MLPFSLGFKLTLNFHFYFFFDPLIIQEHVVWSPYIWFFSSFPPAVDFWFHTTVVRKDSMSSFLNRLTFVTSHFSFLIYSSLVWWHIKVVSIYSSSPFRFLMIPLTYFIVCSLTNHCYFWFFQWSCMVVRVGLWRKLSTEKLMLLNCGVGEDSWESLGLQGDPTSPSWRR